LYTPKSKFSLFTVEKQIAQDQKMAQLLFNICLVTVRVSWIKAKTRIQFERNLISLTLMKRSILNLIELIVTNSMKALKLWSNEQNKQRKKEQ